MRQSRSIATRLLAKIKARALMLRLIEHVPGLLDGPDCRRVVEGKLIVEESRRGVPCNKCASGEPTSLSFAVSSARRHLFYYSGSTALMMNGM